MKKRVSLQTIPIIRVVRVISEYIGVFSAVRVNGDFDIPYENEEDEIAPVLETYILDVVIAESIARALNHVNRKKFKTLREAVEKAEVMMDQIDKKGYV